MMRLRPAAGNRGGYPAAAARAMVRARAETRPPMDTEAFRRLALALPGAEERSHLGNPDFRVGGKIFATLGGGTGRPVVKLAPDEQALLLEAEPGLFTPASGAWGRAGSTHIQLDRADEATVRDALERAHRNVSTPRRRPSKRHTP
jgi:hypothetical protein